MQQPFTSGKVSLGGSGGYAIDIRAPGGDVIFLDAFNNPQQELPSGAEAVYAVHPTSLLSSGVLAADFGQLGFISLSFVPRGKPRVGRVPRGCRGRRPRNAQGSYHGTISLHGENGFFEIERVRAGGTRHRSFRLVCAKGRARHPEVSRPLADYLGPPIGRARANGSHLEAVSEANGRQLAFLAQDFPHDTVDEEEAGLRESRPGIETRRWVLVSGPTTFQTSSPGAWPRTGTVFPHAPFRGTATFSEDSVMTASWSGSLEVGFPGLTVPLTGSDFHAELTLKPSP